MAGPDGLTGQASTFTRADVVDALCKHLPVAPSAQATRAQAAQVAEQFLGGIATVGLGEEGFSDVRTVDRLLLDLGKGQGDLDDKTVLVVDEAAMLGTRKLTPLLDHAQRRGTKVILVGDDRQFAPIDAGGGFRALRVRLGASELTENRRQVAPWEQQALDDVRAGRIEQAIVAYAEHERIRAYEATDERDRALLHDWFAAHQAGEAPVIYAHRRAQVDRLNLLCQRLRAQAGELGHSWSDGRMTTVSFSRATSLCVRRGRVAWRQAPPALRSRWGGRVRSGPRRWPRRAPGGCGRRRGRPGRAGRGRGY